MGDGVNSGESSTVLALEGATESVRRGSGVADKHDPRPEYDPQAALTQMRSSLCTVALGWERARGIAEGQTT